jgi:gliding motility-associated-like protein
MRSKKTTLFIIFFIFFTSISFSQSPTVVISDHNNNTGTINIDCPYSFIPPKKIRLTATFPDLKSTTDYTVTTNPFTQSGNFFDGTPIVFTGDDTWSSSIPIGFSFCFYGNNYNSVNVGDNGIVRFGYNSSIPEGSFSSITNTTPNPSLVKNAIFGGFQDMLNIPVGFGCAVGENCGSVKYITSGTAPFRKFVVNFNGVKHFNCYGLNGRKSTFQVVLYETTNVIEINVKDKPLTCNGNVSANGNGNSLIGLNNANGTMGISPIGRNTGVWSVLDESYKFTPNGVSNTQINWYNSSGGLLGSSNPIDVIPPTNDTFYTATVLYNTCTPIQISSTINVVYSLDFPVAPNITANFCDTALPFPSESVDIESLLVPEAGIVKTIHNTQFEADAGINALTGMNVYNMISTTQIFYYRKTFGACYATGTITANLFQTPPQFADQYIYVCDTNNDGLEVVALNGLANQITGYQPWMAISYYQNLPNAIQDVNPFSSVTVTTIPGFYDVYIRVINPANPNCWTVSKIIIRILPKLELAPIVPFCINDPDFNLQENYDLTTVPITIITGSGTINVLYYTSLSDAQNGTNPILDPANYLVNIPQPATNATVYMVATATGFCPTILPITISFCVAIGIDPNDPNGNGGGGGFGGEGACLESGAPIPSYNLNVVYNNVMSAVVPVPASIGFYTTLLGAQTQDISVLLTLAQVSNFTPVAPFSEIWVRYIDANGTVGIKRIIVPVKFIKHINRDYAICDILNDGQEIVDLLPYIAQIQLENPGETVTCYASPIDYASGTNPITSINILSPNTIVYVKVRSYGCNSNYDLNFILNPFDIGTSILKQVCDIGSDGTEPFNLAALIPSLGTGFTNPTISLHSTLVGAYTETNLIPNSTTNYPVNPTTTVWVRIEEDPTILPLTCPTIIAINFGFFNSVSTNTIATLEICDIDNDGQVPIPNLNAIVASMVNEIPTEPIIKKLYSDLVSAQTNNPVFEILPNWDLFIYDTTIFGVNGIIYLYLENTITGCTRIVPINVTVKSLPIAVNPTVDICDFGNDNNEVIANMSTFNSQITTNYFLYNYQYFETLANATAGNPVIPLNFSVQNGTIVYVKITSGTVVGCEVIVPIQINLQSSPLTNNITPLICDNLGNGTELVNLNSYQTQIISNITGLSFQYYSSQSDALQNLNPFSNFTTANYSISSFNASNIAPPIFVRVTNTTSGCFSISTIIFERRTIIEAFDSIQFACDISLTNELNGVFDLTTSIPRINGSGMIVNPSAYIISYHNNLNDATLGISSISSPNNYNVTANQTSYIYVRFLDNITGCFTVKVLELQIYNLPKFVNSFYDVCDDNLDGQYIINLTSLNITVVEDPTPYTFQYYLTQTDAYAGINPITNIANYTININEFPKIIYVKGTNINNCSKVKSVTLEHKPEVPLLLTNAIITECDDNNDGVEFFNLTDAQSMITSQGGVTFTYFTSIANLQANTNPIVNPTTYQNLTPNPSVVYVRVSAPTTNCDNWATITLNPFYQEYIIPNQITLCDNNANGTEIVNLAQTVYSILSNYNSATLNLEFYFTLADANAGINIITNPQTYLFTNFATPIFVKIINISTGCPIVKELHFINPPAIILTPKVISICDYNRNNSEVINLSTYFNQLSLSATNYNITSYLAEAAANTGSFTDQISNINYLQTQVQQIFWIRFVDTNGCYSVASLTINIIPLPNPRINPPLLIHCDDTNSGDLTEIFDITTNKNYILNGSNDLVTYHATQNDADNGLNPIINPINYSSPTASVWIRVTTNPVSSVTNCAVVIEQKLIVNRLPLAGPVSDYFSCISTNTGEAIFVLNSKNAEALVGQSQTMFTVNYHLTQNDAKLGINPISNIFSSISRLIWISVRNNSTGCINTTSLNLITEIRTTASAPTINLTTVCDLDGNNNGLTVFDLTTLNATIIGANQIGYAIEYFASLADFNSNNPITNPSNFTNTLSTQTIYAKVTNLATVNKCAADTHFSLVINLLPEPTPNGGTSCYNQTTGNLISSHIINSGLSPVTHTFEWYNNTTLIPNQNGSTLEVTEAGTYFVIATNIQTRCESEPKEAIVIRSEPAIASALVEYSFQDNIKIIVTSVGKGNYIYQLDNEAIQASNVFENVEPGTHVITVYDTFGCNPTEIEVVVLDYDKFFTPNGDGYNDTWHIAGIKGQPNAKVYVFDRFGKLLKELSPEQEGWNGTYNEEKLPATDYWFTVNYVENGQEKIFKTHFALKR